MRNYLKDKRKELNLTQEQVAEKINCCRQMYCFIENGNRQKNISVDLLVKLADIFSIPVSELIESENSYKSKLIS